MTDTEAAALAVLAEPGVWPRSLRAAECRPLAAAGWAECLAGRWRITPAGRDALRRSRDAVTARPARARATRGSAPLRQGGGTVHVLVVRPLAAYSPAELADLDDAAYDALLDATADPTLTPDHLFTA